MKKLSIIALCIFGLISSVNAKTDSHIEDDKFDPCTITVTATNIYVYCVYTEETATQTINQVCTKTSTLSCPAAEAEALECVDMKTFADVVRLRAAIMQHI